jgi:RNA polymerase sigma-70 factor, ECF subfamily
MEQSSPSAPPVTASEPELDSRLAGRVKALQQQGEGAEARASFEELVIRHQRRASRIAYRYLGNAADADEAVQDAFIRAFSHLSSFQEGLSFSAWFTRILVNGCVDRLRTRARRSARFVPFSGGAPEGPEPEARFADRRPSPEAQLLARERRQQMAAAVWQLPPRQRAIVVLTHYEGRTPREVGELTGLNESTVRVHLFRAVRKLRKLLPQLAGPGHEDTGRVHGGDG